MKVNSFELRSKLFSSGIIYANHPSFSSNWNILHLSWLFDLLHILLYYFCDSIILSCQFTLSKEKKLRRNVAFSTTAICIYSASSTYTYLQITAHSANLTGDKNMAFLRFFAFFQFLTCLPFGAPCLFWPSRFLKILFRLFIPTF